ncbi:MAG: M13 family metallopeptidase [Dokdonella sp.]
MQRIRWMAMAMAAALCATGGWAADGAKMVSSKPVGVDLAAVDHAIRPGNDFDAYANGGWRKVTEIPADRSSTGVFFQVFQKAEQRNAQLIRDAGAGKPAAGSNARRIADYYTAYMDEAGIEKAGLTPLKPTLATIDAIASKADLARVLGAGLRADVDPINATHLATEHLFGLFVAQELQDPSHNVAYLLQGGLGMPNRDYYLSNDKDMVSIRAKYQTYVAELLKLADVADVDVKSKLIVELETKIANAQASVIDSEDVHKANNPWAIDAFATEAPGLDWPAYFKAAGLEGQKQIVAWQADAIHGLSALVASEPLQVWKDYLTFHAINENAGLLPRAYDDAAFDFFGRTLQGTPQQRDRWKRAISETNADLGDAVGQLYVQRYFPAASKAQVQQMVVNILAAFSEHVEKLDWMTAATKAKAKAKIATVRVGVGYPETWRDYASTEIRADDALGNHLRAQACEYLHQRAKLSQPVDRGEWWMTPQTVNAVNLPLQNALNFPAGILEAPFFDPRADDAANYGSIGAVIGHEISHSFDNNGAEFDAEGRLANWWTPEDEAHFKAAGQRLVEQYNVYEPLPGVHLNGQQVLGENIADVAGLTIAYAAYHKSLNGKAAPVIDALSGDQRFFLAFAQTWRSKVRDAALRQQVVTDGHSPGRFRAQTVRNIDAWYDAFAPKAGDALFLDKKARVRIW